MAAKGVPSLTHAFSAFYGRITVILTVYTHVYTHEPQCSLTYDNYRECRPEEPAQRDVIVGSADPQDQYGLNAPYQNEV